MLLKLYLFVLRLFLELFPHIFSSQICGRSCCCFRNVRNDKGSGFKEPLMANLRSSRAFSLPVVPGIPMKSIHSRHRHCCFKLVILFTRSSFKMLWIACCLHCVQNVRIRSYCGPYFPVFSPNAGKYGPE